MVRDGITLDTSNGKYKKRFYAFELTTRPPGVAPLALDGLDVLDGFAAPDAFVGLLVLLVEEVLVLTDVPFLTPEGLFVAVAEPFVPVRT